MIDVVEMRQSNSMKQKKKVITKETNFRIIRNEESYQNNFRNSPKSNIKIPHKQIKVIPPIKRFVAELPMGFITTTYFTTEQRSHPNYLIDLSHKD